jgi:hypothetical protein
MVEERLWAFTVSPARTANNAGAPVGGALGTTPDLSTALSGALGRPRQDQWTEVAFTVSEIRDATGSRRSSPTRDLAMAAVFGDASAANEAAAGLAHRLSAAMDHRSLPHLLVISTIVDGDLGTMALWAFPPDDAFRFEATTHPTIELLRNVFSLTSRLRKAARFSGQPHDQSFLRGEVLDFQTGRVSIDLANYWVGSFLDCVLAVTPVVGTELLAQSIRKLNEGLSSPEDRRQLAVAVLALQQSPKPSWTLDEVADTLLSPELGDRLRARSSRPTMNGARFKLDNETFERLVSIRTFELESGVIVSSPIGEVGESVRVSGNKLECEGTIVGERLRGRRGRAA